MKKTIMNSRFTTIALVILLCGIMIPAQAQIKKVGQAGMQFLKIEMSARSAAMGGAYTLAGSDATALFSNPAGMAQNDRRIDVYAAQVPWIADISYNALAATFNAGNIGTFGFQYIGADYGNDIIGTRYDATTDAGFIETGALTVEAMALGLSYARSLTDKFSIGATAKKTYQHLGANLMPADSTIKQNELDGIAFDFGTIFYPGWKSLRFGMSIRNFAKDYKYEEDRFSFPMEYRMGVAMDILHLFGEHTNPLLVEFDAIHPRDYTERLNVGLEYLFNNMFAFRAGYRFNYDIEGLTAGFGTNVDLGFAAARIDYAWSDLGVFDMTHRLAVGFSF